MPEAGLSGPRGQARRSESIATRAARVRALRLRIDPRVRVKPPSTMRDGRRPRPPGPYRAVPPRGRSPTRTTATARAPCLARSLAPGLARPAGADGRLRGLAPAPWRRASQSPGRRTVTIQGRGSERYAPSVDHRRPARKRHERDGFKPDRVAMWAVLLGLLLILVAATSSHAAIRSHAAIARRAIRPPCDPLARGVALARGDALARGIRSHARSPVPSTSPGCAEHVRSSGHARGESARCDGARGAGRSRSRVAARLGARRSHVLTYTTRDRPMIERLSVCV